MSMPCPNPKSEVKFGHIEVGQTDINKRMTEACKKPFKVCKPKPIPRKHVDSFRYEQQAELLKSGKDIVYNSVQELKT